MSEPEYEDVGDPEAAAAAATGAGGEGGDEESGGRSGEATWAPTASSGPLARLFDGRASGPSVGRMEADYGLDKPQATVARGLTRVGSGDGVPPIAEIVLGSILWVLSRRADAGASVESDTMAALDGEHDRDASAEGQP